MTKTMRYLALLRGVNVGGKAKLNMAELKAALVTAGFTNVVTYITSGNVVFASDRTGTQALAEQVHAVIANQFGMNIDVIVLSAPEWQAIVDGAPSWWGNEPGWKHNVLVLLPPYDMDATVAGIGILNPDIERIATGPGVVYQAMSIELVGKTTTGNLSASPSYRRLTIRNYNTTQKLMELLGN